MSPLVEIGLADLPKIGGARAPRPPTCDGPELFLQICLKISVLMPKLYRIDEISLNSKNLGISSNFKPRRFKFVALTGTYYQGIVKSTVSGCI